MQVSQDDSKTSLEDGDLSGQARLLEERFRALALATGQIIWSADPQGNLAGDLNPWCAFTGQTPQEAAGGGWAQVAHPDDRAGIRHAWGDAITRQTPYEYEARIRRFDGEFRWMLVRAAPVFGSAGRVREWIGTCTDITEIRRTEQQASQQARELATILDTMADGVAVYDPTGNIMRMNPVARHNVAGNGSVPPDLQERLSYYHMRDAATERLLSLEELPLSRILRGETLSGNDAMDVTMDMLDGQERTFAISGAPLRDDVGDIQGAVVISRDITQRLWLALRTRQALSALLELAQALVVGIPSNQEATNLAESARRMVGCARAAVTTYDATTGIQQPFAIAGVTAEEAAAWHAGLANTRLADFLEPRQLQALLAGHNIQLDVTPEPRSEHAFGSIIALLCPMRVDGELVGVLSLDFGPVPHDYSTEEIEIAGGIAGLLSMVIERERLVAQREAANASALAAVHAKKQMDEFLSIVGHELRTPLTSLLANVQISARQLSSLRPMLSDDSYARVQPKLERLDLLVGRVETQSQRLRRLVDDLLDVSRIEGGKLQLAPAPCDLLAIVREAVAEQRVSWPERRIVLALSRRKDLIITADADRIGQVVTNYLTNALKYSPDLEPVLVKVGARGGVARVEVVDHGPGIALEDQQHLFERFYRVPGIKVQQRAEVGLGLGLYICRTIIERHGGQMGVISAPGQETRFWFTLPLTEPPPALTAPQP